MQNYLKHITVIVSFCAISTKGYGTIPIPEPLLYLGHVNVSSPIETAGSHGAYGFKLGIGAQFTPPNSSQNINNDLFLSTEAGTNDMTYFPKVYWSRGMNIPLNFGFSYGQSPDQAEQWSGFAQWVVFEKFKWPAVALRAAISKLTGLSHSEITTYNSGAIISYGFLKYFNLYYSFQGTMHSAKSITHENEAKSYSWNDSNQTEGIEITIFPPFLKASFEHNHSSLHDSYSSKIAYLF